MAQSDAALGLQQQRLVATELMSLSCAVLEQQPSNKGKDVRFFKILNRGLQPMSRGPKVARELKFCGRRRGQIFKQALRFLKGITKAGSRVL